MAKIIATSEGGSGFKPVSEGLHTAVCSGVIDLGVQSGSAQYPKPKRKVYLRFDVLDEEFSYEKDGKQMSGPGRVGQTFTLSLGENAKLRPLLESWRGKKFTETELKAFDISALAGVPAQVQVLHERKGEKTYANIVSIVPWPKGVPAPKCEAITYSPSEHNPAVYNELPEWLRKAIDNRLADDYAELDAKPSANHDLRPRAVVESDPGHGDSFDQDIPFLPCEYRSLA